MMALVIGISLLMLLFLGIPVFACLALVGGGALLFLQGELGPVSELIFHDISRYVFVTIPLFAYMAHVMIRSGIVDDLYETAYILTRHLPGGLAIATVGACTLFAAISGSSVATALTVGAVAIPQMIRFGYAPRLAYGLVAAGGTLGILIPPSGPMVLFGVITNTSIAGLFMAGIVPGLLMGLVFIGWSMWSNVRSAMPVRREPRATLPEAFVALRKAAWAFALPVFVLVGMYCGAFTATEAAAIGAMMATLVGALIYRSLNLRMIFQSAADAAKTAGMLFMVVGGAAIFAYVLTQMHLPQQLVDWISQMDIGVYGFLILLMAILFLLGVFLESVALILVTTPVVLPVLQYLHIDPIWYGVLLVIKLELALIMPPMGMNLFTIKSITSAPLGEITRGAIPYAFLMLLMLAMVMAFPAIALWLPSQLIR